MLHRLFWLGYGTLALLTAAVVFRRTKCYSLGIERPAFKMICDLGVSAQCGALWPIVASSWVEYRRASYARLLCPHFIDWFLNVPQEFVEPQSRRRKSDRALEGGAVSIESDRAELISRLRDENRRLKLHAFVSGRARTDEHADLRAENARLRAWLERAEGFNVGGVKVLCLFYDAEWHTGWPADQPLCWGGASGDLLAALEEMERQIREHREGVA